MLVCASAMTMRGSGMTDQLLCRGCNHPVDEHEENDTGSCKASGCDCSLDKVVTLYALELEKALDETEKNRIADNLVNLLYTKYSAEHDAELDRMLERDMLFGSPGLRAFAVSDSWDMRGLSDVMKEAESALAPHDAMRAPDTDNHDLHLAKHAELVERINKREADERVGAVAHGCKCAWTVLDGERIRDSAVCNYCHMGYSFPVLTGIENGQGDPCCGKCFVSYGYGEQHICDPRVAAGLHSFKKKACECRVMRAIDVIHSGLDYAALTAIGWEQLADAPGYRLRCDEHKVESNRVSPSVDVCIKHRFRGTAEQPGCSECAAAGEGGFFMGVGADSQIRCYGAVSPDLTEPYRTFLLTGITEPTPANDFDDTTEPSEPQKHSDERLPAWLSSEPPEATSKACGCFTYNGVTLPCLACAKGGG